MIVDKACYERGCACYDIGDESVEVVRKEWVGLTKEEIDECYEKAMEMEPYMGAITRINLVKTIEAKLKEKNT